MHKRLIIIYSCLILCVTILFVRIGVLTTDSMYIDIANNQSKYTLEIQNTRGSIYDRNLNNLVNKKNTVCYSVFPTATNIMKMHDSLTTDEKKVIETALQKNRPIVVDYNLEGIKDSFITKFYKTKRYDNTACHIIGYTNDNVGVTGIEKAYDEYLTKYTKSTKITYNVDGYNKPFYDESPSVNIAPSINSGIVLTLDENIQRICEEVGEKYIKKGAIVVLDANTSEILASVSLPTFDVYNLEKSVKDTTNYPMLNKAFSAYTIGSTFKIVIAAAALECGYSPNMAYDCKGYVVINGKRINCHNKNGHGIINMEDAISYSCNPFFIDLALKLDSKKLYSIASKLSFGSDFILAPGLSTKKGNLPKIYEHENNIKTANFAFGQGDLLATPIQIGLMMSAICNGGYVNTPSLVLGTTEDGKNIENLYNSEKKQAVSEKTASLLRKMLINGVMNSNNQNARPDTIIAGGKTSTAQTGKFDGDVEILNAWFSGFFSLYGKDYVVTVLDEDGKTGNASASPIFAEIVNRLAN